MISQINFVPGDVLKVYQVNKVFEPGTKNDSKTYQNLKEEIKNKSNILKENSKDAEEAKKSKLKDALIKRLILDEAYLFPFV